MRRLLFISNLFPDQAQRYRGLDNAVLLGYLRKHFDDIRVVALRPTLDARLWMGDALEQQAGLPWQARPEDEALRPVYLPVPYAPKVGGLVNDVLIARRLEKLLRRWEAGSREAFDGVLASWLFPDGCAVSEVMHRRGVPHLLIAQGSDVHQYLEMPLRRRKILRALDRAGGLITRSAKLAELCAEAGARRERLHPVYNGVNTRLFFPPRDQAAVREALRLPVQGALVLFVGNFLPVKNPLMLIEAFAGLGGSAGEGHLVMIGSGPLQGEMERLAREKGVGERLILPGRKEPGEVAEYMRAADCLALSSWNEGVPNVVLEAMAGGLPLVSTEVGGIHEVWPGPECGAVARFTPAGDAGRFRENLEAVLQASRGEGGGALRAALRRHGESYRWELTAERYAELLEGLEE